MARNDVYLNINALSPADAVVTGQQDMTAATVPELVLGDTPTFNFLFTDNTNVWPSWAGNASYTLTWALSDAVAGDFAPAATTGNATPITGGWSVILPLNSYDLVGLLNTKRVGQPYPVQNLWQQLRVTDPSGNEVTRAMFWTPVRYRAISDTQNTESASPTGGRFVTVNNVNTLTTPTAAQFYAANPVPTSALGTAANGELLIGNGTGFTKSTLTAGTGITVTNGSGSITIDASGAQETLTATVKNAESVAITKGQVVYLFGATGNMPSVKLAYNTTDATSAKTFGVVSDSSIAPNGTGTVTCVGVVDGLNLGAYQDGDTLYLGATPGSVTATKPYAPNHLVYVGIIERANAGNGELYVRIQNGYELDEIHDVQINSPLLAGQTLIYDATTDLWKNARLTGTANQITVTNADAAVTLSIPTNPTLPGNLTVSGTTDSSSKDTGAIVTEGGLGVEKSATIGGNLTVSGTGTHTFGTTNTVTMAAGALTSNITTAAAGFASNGVFNNSTTTGAALLYLTEDLANTQYSRIIRYGSTHATKPGVLEFNQTGTAGYQFTGGGPTTLSGNLTVSGTGTSSVGGAFNIGANCYVPNANYYRGKNAAGSSDYRLIGVTSGNVVSIDPDAAGATFGGNLTVSGTGNNIFNSGGGNFLIGTTTNRSNRVHIAAAGPSYIGMGQTTSTYAGIVFGDVTLADSASGFNIAGNAANSNLVFNVNTGGSMNWRVGNANAFTLSSASNFLIATTTDSGNGRIQLATHTTSAGGIGFGTDVSLFRSAAGVLRLASTSNYSHEIVNTAGTGAATTSYSNTGGYLFVGIDSSSGGALGGGAYAGVISRDGAYSLILRTNSTTALTLDSSQNATFAKKISANGSTTWASASSAQLFWNTVTGANLAGSGSSYDVSVLNKNGDLALYVPTGTQNTTFAGAIAIGNTVQTAAGVSSTHKVTISIGGSTYYLLATNV